MRVGLTLLLTFTFASAVMAQESAVEYSRDIKPLLKQRCFACHGALQQKAGLRLDTSLLIRRGGDSGPAILAGNVTGSLVIERISSNDAALRMPAEGKPLTVAGLRSASSQSSFHRHKVGGDEVSDKRLISGRAWLVTPI